MADSELVSGRDAGMHRDHISQVRSRAAKGRWAGYPSPCDDCARLHQKCPHVALSPPTYGQLGELSDLIMRAASDAAHYPYPVGMVAPYELAWIIMQAGYRKV